MLEVALTLEIDSDADKRSPLINRVSEALTTYFDGRSYGSDIEGFLIGVICIKTHPGYEAWFKKRRPRYRAFERVDMHDGTHLEVRNSYGYDIKFEPNDCYEAFVNGSEEEALALLIDLLIDSLSNFDKLPKKVRDFDAATFKKDAADFLRTLTV